MKTLCVLGSTGSIGTQTLEIAARYPEEFRIEAITCGRNIELFREQLRTFSPKLAACADEKDALELSKEFPKTFFCSGTEGICDIAAGSCCDMTVNSLMGMMGIRPTYAAVRAGYDIAFANKEYGNYCHFDLVAGDFLPPGSGDRPPEQRMLPHGYGHFHE